MYRSRIYTVTPYIPESLANLKELIYNFWWSWNIDAVDLFRRLDTKLWHEINHNPVKLLALIRQDRIEQAAEDPGFLAHLERAIAGFRQYMGRTTWFERTYGASGDHKIAYFSAEFGIHESLPSYSGGLGVLAGDHLKSASDLGIPLVGVCLLYRQGYFHQYLTTDGWQFEDYPDINFSLFPISVVRQSDGSPLRFDLDVGHRKVLLQVWVAKVGLVNLYFLDANLQENAQEDRDITARLYGGDQETRIKQEIVLGIGGMRALKLMGIKPTVCHMNEGHSAFLGLERIRHLMIDHGLDFDTAREAVAGSNLFTTHTPVAAGIDTFPTDLVEHHLGPYVESMGLSKETLNRLGDDQVEGSKKPFSMAALAMRLAHRCNGVSKLHGEVSRKMWQRLWREVPVEEVPIGSVTNGIHTQSWLSLEMSRLFDRYMGPDWSTKPVDAEIWKHVDEIPDAELWRAKSRVREHLVVKVRHIIRDQWLRRGSAPAELAEVEQMLDPEALTIGFARRFAPYKRGNLLLHNVERLVRILGDEKCPVQVLIAGKAHPRDTPGKELIKRLVQFSRKPEIRARMVFIEDYDINVARYLVQGVDLWLNNPRRPLEASGTSGMKVPGNGGINLSVLDGWWPEAYDGENGWAIGDNRDYNNDDYQDFVESESIYQLLEREIIPMFYERGSDGLPRRWIARMKASMRTICPMFNTGRMLREYTERYYIPASLEWRIMAADQFTPARSLAQWKKEVAQRWDEVRVESFEADDVPERQVGGVIRVRARVHLGQLTPDHARVQLYDGVANNGGEIRNGRVLDMSRVKSLGNGTFEYAGEILCESSGRFGYAVRVVPHHEYLVCPYDLRLIRWG